MATSANTIKEVEAALREAARREGILCPECGSRVRDFVLNRERGFVCRGCDWAIRLVDG